MLKIDKDPSKARVSASFNAVLILNSKGILDWFGYIDMLNSNRNKRSLWWSKVINKIYHLKINSVDFMYFGSSFISS